MAASDTRLGRKDTLCMLKGMRRKGKRWAAAACDYRKIGGSGLSAGVLMAIKKVVNAMIPETDHEGLTWDPWVITTIPDGDAEVILIAAR